jgi:hypothetical protein
MNFYPDRNKPTGNNKTGTTLNTIHQQVFRIMKITVLLVTIFCVQLSAAAYSQRVSLNERNMPLEQVLKEIKRQTGYYFLYDADLIQQKSKPVSINVKDVAIETVMAQALKAQPFSWEMKENTILIKPIMAKLNTSQSAIDVRGRINDETGQPLPGVTVKVKGTSNSTVTDINGNFTLTNVPDNATLVVSYIGYTSVEISAASQVGSISFKRCSNHWLHKLHPCPIRQCSNPCNCRKDQPGAGLNA